MIFEEFLKDARIKKGLKQSELADMLFISEKTLSGYETSRRQCTFNFGMEILNKLELSVLIKDNKIELVEGDIKMEKDYINNNLDFINFNKEQYINEILNYREKCISEFQKDFDTAVNMLSEKGFEVSTSVVFDKKLWLDEHYQNEDRLLDITKDEKTISLRICGYLNINFFIIERFIEFIKEKDSSISEYIYKAILYTIKSQNNGREIYEYFRNKDINRIIKHIPMLEPYKIIIEETLESNYDYIFVTIDCISDPANITIANDINMYDCSSTPYIYYTYIMEDGEEVIDYEASFEGHDIADALSYASVYFEDYEDYKRNYELKLSNCEDEMDREIVIL